MKGRFTIAIGAVLALAGGAWWITTPVSQRSPIVRFMGLTNGDVGSNVVQFSSLSSNHAAFVQRWFVAGTNAAVFTISNSEACTIKVCTCSFQMREDHRAHQQTWALDSPVPYGFYLLQPGQAVTSHVAVIPHRGPWRVAFSYNRHDRREKLRAMSAVLRRAPPIQLYKYEVHSDWIDE